MSGDMEAKDTVMEVISEIKNIENNKILIVCVEKSSSKEWDILEKINVDPDSYLFLQLKEDSPGFKEFTDIYPVLMLPSIYIIENTGYPLAVLGGDITNQKLEERMNDIISKQKARRISIETEENNVNNTSSEVLDVPSQENNTHDDEEAKDEKQKGAKIQFRFKDGPKLVQTFDAFQTFQDIDIFVKTTKGYFKCSYKSLYPSRVFNESDYTTTLDDLGLVPSNVLYVVPIKETILPAPIVNNTQKGFLDLLMLPIYMVLNIIQSTFRFIFRRPRN